MDEENVYVKIRDAEGITIPAETESAVVVTTLKCGVKNIERT